MVKIKHTQSKGKEKDYLSGEIHKIGSETKNKVKMRKDFTKITKV